MDPGLKGCQYLLGTLPSWINYTEREKMEVRAGCTAAARDTVRNQQHVFHVKGWQQGWQQQQKKVCAACTVDTCMPAYSQSTQQQGWRQQQPRQGVQQNGQQLH
jgi:hypothetical protein